MTLSVGDGSPKLLAAGSTVGDYKLVLGPQILSFWQGPDYPVRSIRALLCRTAAASLTQKWYRAQNGTVGVPYVGSNNTYDCGNQVTMEGGCLFNIIEDPNEIHDLAASMPDVLHSLKSRYLELRATAYDQRAPIAKSNEPAFKAQMNALYSAALKRYGGFQGPFWGAVEGQ